MSCDTSSDVASKAPHVAVLTPQPLQPRTAIAEVDNKRCTGVEGGLGVLGVLAVVVEYSAANDSRSEADSSGGSVESDIELVVVLTASALSAAARRCARRIAELVSSSCGWWQQGQSSPSKHPFGLRMNWHGKHAPRAWWIAPRLGKLCCLPGVASNARAGGGGGGGGGISMPAVGEDPKETCPSQAEASGTSVAPSPGAATEGPAATESPTTTRFLAAAAADKWQMDQYQEA
eukprot:CAMPEP_0176094968 /NCGR_PEP_ID=MMETSP0120_2-20121206/47595_1 /TAXON_ID=160619 /ORGANISM="Kryptoperidinium foliaceum, Strain CCMP 1326" /LENGTH=232 /DNA_ID=CAMNT_0017428923 /DNA_START=142 /DNA_END=838 /DNA_ORIENTATION=+